MIGIDMRRSNTKNSAFQDKTESLITALAALGASALLASLLFL
jgi:hypothetical protein